MKARGIPHITIGDRSLEHEPLVQLAIVILCAWAYPDFGLALYSSAEPDDLELRLERGEIPKNLRCELAKTWWQARSDEWADLYEAASRLADHQETGSFLDYLASTKTMKAVLEDPSSSADYLGLIQFYRVVGTYEEVFGPFNPDRAQQFLKRGLRALFDHIEVFDEDLDPPPADAVTCSTIHRAKGLEYPVVVFIPPDSSVWQNRGEESFKDSANNLAYVAASRAGLALVLLDREGSISPDFSKATERLRQMASPSELLPTIDSPPDVCKLGSGLPRPIRRLEPTALIVPTSCQRRLAATHILDLPGRETYGTLLGQLLHHISESLVRRVYETGSISRREIDTSVQFYMQRQERRSHGNSARNLPKL